MQTKVEGLLLSKRAFQERHVVGTLLLRNGKLCSVTFYGGKGGGKKKKSSILEVGFMLKVELTKPRKPHAPSERPLYQAKEWDLIWYHQHIRHSLGAFHTLYFMSEVISKLGVEAHLEDELEDPDSVGLFKVLSNGFYYFDHLLVRVEKGQDLALSYAVLSFFLGKLLIELGVFPEVNQCVVTGEALDNLEQKGAVRFLPDQGGFALQAVLNEHEGETRNLQDDRPILQFLRYVAQTRFQEFSFNPRAEYAPLARRLFHYFCYHFQFKEEQFRTFSLIFS